MVLKSNIGKLVKGVIFILLVMLFSCEEIKTIVINCSKCTLDEPRVAETEIKLNPDGYSSVLVTIYEGNVEDSINYSSFWVNSNSTTCSLPLNKKFSFSAKYYSAGRDTYYCINSTTVHIKYIEDQCDSPCYMIYDNVVNLRILHH
jgi:hypothetical protein